MIPVDDPIVAIAVLLLAHVPPPVLVRVAGVPTHDDIGPLIDDGRGLTVKDDVVRQLVPKR